jgi:hypothetical protein
VQIFHAKHATRANRAPTERYVSGNSLFFRMNRILDIYFVGGFGTVQVKAGMGRKGYLVGHGLGVCPAISGGGVEVHCVGRAAVCLLGALLDMLTCRPLCYCLVGVRHMHPSRICADIALPSGLSRRLLCCCCPSAAVG